MKLSKLCAIGMLGVFGLVSCQKDEVRSSLEKESRAEQSSKKRKDIYLSDLSILSKKNIPKEFFRRDGLRAFNSSYYARYDFSHVIGLQNTETGNTAYIIPKLGEPNVYLAVAYNQDFGVTSVVKMSYTKDDSKGEYVVNICDEGGVSLFNFSTDLKSYKVLKSNANYDSLRAGGYAWACGLSLGAVGGMWGTVVGMVNPLAGLAVGMAYTALSIWACDESKIGTKKKNEIDLSDSKGLGDFETDSLVFGAPSTPNGGGDRL